MLLLGSHVQMLEFLVPPALQSLSLVADDFACAPARGVLSLLDPYVPVPRVLFVPVRIGQHEHVPLPHGELSLLLLVLLAQEFLDPGAR